MLRLFSLSFRFLLLFFSSFLFPGLLSQISRSTVIRVVDHDGPYELILGGELLAVDFFVFAVSKEDSARIGVEAVEVKIVQIEGLVFLCNLHCPSFVTRLLLLYFFFDFIFIFGLILPFGHLLGGC